LKNINILIIGFGAIGCRHAQSLLDNGNKNLSIIDENKDNIQKGLDAIGYSVSDVRIIDSFDEIGNEIPDLAIIATSAEPRFDIYKELINRKIKFFLLEKVLFQSHSQFKYAIDLTIQNGVKSYCNFPNRYFDNYIRIKKRLKNIDNKISMSVTGGDCGIGCSGIHYLDLFEYLTNSKINYTNSILEKWNKDNKRGDNYTDFSGMLIATNKKNDILRINFDKSHVGPCSVSISYQDNEIVLYEGSEIEFNFNKKNSFTNSFSIIPQSRLTAQLADDIFNDKSLMPSIEQAANSHLHLIKECNKIINKKNVTGFKCPIT
tara:strand:+ start:658 stop:1611 length:954 start_codon:yes stop_codon:yes gene_type:complete